MHTRWLFSLPVIASLVFAQTPPAAPKPTAPKPAAPKAVAPKPVAAKPAAPPAPARPPGSYATISIVHGTQPLGNIVFKFYDKESPITTKNFIDLARGTKPWLNPKTGTKVRLPLYNGLTFHRVIPGFMIQGGDPLGNGTGGTDPIVDEFHPSLRFDVPGRVAMANAGPGTGSSQFFITEGKTDWLDGRHTIFGQVIEGQELVKTIANLPKGPGDKPNVPVKMSRVLITVVADPNAPKPVPAAVKKAAPKAAAPKPAAAPAAAKKQ
jgi:peptidyl-prolyl cis-trans isomerase A (cyclophilin A)